MGDSSSSSSTSFVRRSSVASTVAAERPPPPLYDTARIRSNSSPKVLNSPSSSSLSAAASSSSGLAVPETFNPPVPPGLTPMICLPIPLLNKHFVLAEFPKSRISEWTGGVSGGNFSPDDFVICSNGAFVETNTAQVALSLKKIYDQLYGAGKDGVKSPYVIASMNHEGEFPVYRISYRETSTSTSPPPEASSPPSRSTRRSVGDYLSSVVKPHPLPPSTSSTSGGAQSMWGSSTGTTRSKGHHRLRKPRSNSQIGAQRSRAGTVGSVKSSAQSSELSGGHPNLSAKAYRGTAEADIFAELLGWDVPPSRARTDSLMSSSAASISASASGSASVPNGLDSMDSTEAAPESETVLSKTDPFGDDVTYDEPPEYRSDEMIKAPVLHLSKVEPTLRVMQSFDSSLTARAPSSEPTEIDHGEKTVNMAPRPRVSTELFDAFQELTGMRRRDPTGAQTYPGTPEDDPRFVIWGTRILIPIDVPAGPEGVFKYEQRRILVAATVERWVAQLTSELDYDELLNFYLTYRQYISPLDLCKLLICRFSWTLEKPRKGIEPRVRLLVRVRTFIAIRYWLLTFFSVDFLPNRELRLFFADWLNTIGDDPRAVSSPDVMNTISQLRRIARECRDAHLTKTSSRKPGNGSSMPSRTLATRSSFSTPNLVAPTEKEPASGEVRLDLDLEALRSETSETESSVHQRLDLANTLSDRSALGLQMNQTLQMKILASAQNPASVLPPSKRSKTPLPHHGLISRAFVNTFGRIGRWRRDRTRTTTMVCAAGVDEEDVDGSQDILASSEKLDEYLKTLNIRPEHEEPGSPDTPGASSSNSTDNSKEQSSSLTTPVAPDFGNTSSPDGKDEKEEGEEKLQVLDETPEGNFAAENMTQEDAMSDDSYGQPLSPRETRYGKERAWATPDVVSLDDYEFSDSESSEIDAPHANGLRKPGLSKKLPLRRDFELVRRESVSSLGAKSSHSVAESSASASRASMQSDVAPGSIEPWHLQVMLEENSDDGEPGDAAAALRRLEGQIDSGRQQTKEKRVDGWLKSVRHRVKTGDGDEDAGSEPPSEDDVLTPEDDRGPSAVEGPIPAVAVTETNESKGSIEREREPRGSSDVPPAEHIPAPPEKQEGAASPASPGSKRPSLHPPIQSKFASVSATKLPIPSRHRSFILQYSSDALAREWAIVDRDHLLPVKFEELTHQNSDWAGPRPLPDFTDWVKFGKDRYRLREEAKVHPDRRAPTTFMNLRMRFNVMVNFVASEVVLTTTVADRLALVGKWIRIAWKSYMINNFHAVVAIITGLQTHWVALAMDKLWSKIGLWESRLFSDLRVFISSHDDFLHIREALIPLSTGARPEPHSKTPTSGDMQAPEEPQGAISFIGIYLSQLARHNKLPDFIDPTSPLARVTSKEPTSSDILQADIFEHLTALPESVELVPLVNVHKQRLIATVIKSLVQAQHLASRITWQAESKLYWKCVRLKCLDADTLGKLATRALD